MGALARFCTRVRQGREAAESDDAARGSGRERDSLCLFLGELGLLGIERGLVVREGCLLRLDGLELGDGVRLGFAQLRGRRAQWVSDAQSKQGRRSGRRRAQVRGRTTDLCNVLLELLPQVDVPAARRLDSLVPPAHDVLLEADEAVPLLLCLVEVPGEEGEEDFDALCAERVVDGRGCAEERVEGRELREVRGEEGGVAGRG